MLGVILYNYLEAAALHTFSLWYNPRTWKDNNNLIYCLKCIYKYISRVPTFLLAPAVGLPPLLPYQYRRLTLEMRNRQSVGLVQIVMNITSKSLIFISGLIVNVLTVWLLQYKDLNRQSTDSFLLTVLAVIIIVLIVWLLHC